MTLKTITLNSFYQKYNIPLNRFDFINLDIQGAELLALKGATAILPFIKAIYTEVNEKELYENCGLIDELDAFLRNLSVCTYFNLYDKTWMGGCIIH